MRWYKHLYLSETLQGMKRSVKYDFKYKKIPAGYYCLTLPEYENNLMDIMRSECIKLPKLRGHKKDVVVIGVAAGREEAFELAGQIIYEVYKSTGGFDIKTYLGY